MASLSRSAKSSKRIHWERSQPSERRHLGQLEKRKDYKLRAGDFQRKRDALHALHKKAEERNPDEFYFHMINSQTKDGVHFEKALKVDLEAKEREKKLLAERDRRYVAYKLTVEKKKIEKLKSGLHLLAKEGCSKNKHTIFVDSDKEAKKFNAATHFNTHPRLVDRRFNRAKLDSLRKRPILGATDKESVLAATREQKRQYRELLKRLDREAELRTVVTRLDHKHTVAQKATSDDSDDVDDEDENKSKKQAKQIFERKR